MRFRNHSSAIDGLRLNRRAELTHYYERIRCLRRLGGGRAFGTVSVGNSAELRLTVNDPLDRFYRLRKPQGVMVACRWYDEAALAALAVQTRAGYLIGAPANPSATRMCNPCFPGSGDRSGIRP